MTETCAYCSREASTRDHIVPRLLHVSGMNLGNNNLAPACLPCNQMKGSMTPGALRAIAEDIRKLAARHDALADAVERVMIERGLTP